MLIQKNVQADFPKSLEFLRTPSRYKIAYGGRGAGKSWAFARQLVIDGVQRPIRVLCAREFQSSIQDSVHRLLADQIAALDLWAFYTVEKASIYGINGTTFGFEGIRNNVRELKSYEGADRCWVEEAGNVTRASWEVLIPTIRKEGSEIWISFNTELDTDETYSRFVANPPPNAVVHKVNYTENPWFPQVLRDEMELLKIRDYDAYMNIWEGHPRVTLAGAVYSNELRLATTEGRIMKVPYDETQPVMTFWDLGWADCTSIVFAQKIGFEYHIIDSYQSRLQKLPHYLKVLQDRGYVYGMHYLPHDGDAESLGAPSIKKQMTSAGYKVTILERIQKKQHGIDAVRGIFNRLYIDSVKCADFIQALRHYTYDIDDKGQWSKEPRHDEYSHFADALQELGRSINVIPKRPEAPVEMGSYTLGEAQHGWLGT